MRLDNQLLMVMEYVEGQTLEDRLRAVGRLPAAEAAGYVCQALDALGYAHERGVVHRDIKPANIMVTSSGQVKLMDFGIAKAVAERRLTMTGTTLGSLSYMSPEQVKGSTDLDGRSDLYSVGVSLYEMVTGTLPFKGDSDYSLMVAHLEQVPVPPIELDPSLPPALNEIILTAIQKDRETRFQTAQAFRAALTTVAGMAPAPFAQRAAAPPIGAQQNAPTVPMAPPVGAQAGGPPPTVQAAPVPPPTVAAPAAAAWAQPPLPPPAAPRSGHRGLWMALGGVVVIAVLVVAAIQAPRWVGAKAGGQSVVPAAETPTPAATPVAEAPGGVPPGVSLEPTPSLPPGLTSGQPAVVLSEPSGGTGGARRSGGVALPRQGRTGGGGVQQTPNQPHAEVPAAPPAPPPAPAVDTALLEQLQDRMGQLGPRASAIVGGLQNLERQQKASGYGLRTDIKASWNRMESLLDQADAALKASDTKRAQKYLDQAEQEVERLDKFLGH
jgi:serine/threonine-protein kinase